MGPELNIKKIKPMTKGELSFRSNGQYICYFLGSTINNKETSSVKKYVTN